MRRILAETARRKQSQKQGDQLGRIELDLATPAWEGPRQDLLAPDEALPRLEAQAKLVKLRYFVGLTMPEASEAMGVSTATAQRYWRFSRAWLHAQLKPAE